MVDSQLTSQFSSEVLDAVRRDAARDADDAADILDALGFTGRNASVPPIRLPPAFLLGVGAAARLIRWEAGGIVIHRDAALPKAEDLVKWLFLRLQDLSTGDTRSQIVELCRRTLRLSVERLAWAGPDVMGCDVVLGDVDEDTFLDALAQLAWDRRDRRGRGNESNSE